MRRCRTCQADKDVSDYYRNRKCGTLSLDCKLCYCAKVRKNRAENIAHYREFDRSRGNLPHRRQAREEYAITPHGRARCNAGKRAYLDRNPLKRAAHTATRNAIRDGKLIPQPCEKCSDPKAEAHHDDYSKPLDVRWLCKRHHDEHHAALRVMARQQHNAGEVTP